MMLAALAEIPGAYPRISSMRSPGARAGNILDIAVLAAYLVLAPRGFEAVCTRLGIEVEGFAQIAGITVLEIGFFCLAWMVLKLRGDHPRDVGLRRPPKIATAAGLGLLMAAVAFLLVETVIHTGVWTRDPGNVPPGHPGLLAAWLAFEMFVPGLVEEFVYRGVIMDRLAKVFDFSRLAWPIAIALQAAIFSLAHGYGGLEGLEVGAGFGLVCGLMFVYGGRNLWALIIFHGAYDVARVAYRYFL
jgi:membrane protease YdiL (CAAX protease family)